MVGYFESLLFLNWYKQHNSVVIHLFQNHVTIFCTLGKKDV